MTTVIVYDSIFGNTAGIAKAIAAGLEPIAARLVPVAEAGQLDLATIDLLIIGSPTRGFRPTPAISDFVEGLPQGDGRRAAAFDTRIDLDTVHPAPLRWVVGAGGYAAERIAGTLARKGYAEAGAAAGFEVEGTEGPLKDGEIERARDWAKALALPG